MNTKPEGTIESPKTTFERRIDGWYIRYPLTDWMGPWDTAFEATKYSRMVFGLDDEQAPASRRVEHPHTINSYKRAESFAEYLRESDELEWGDGY